MKIGHKLLSGFLAIALLIGIIGTIGVYSTQYIASVFRHADQDEIPHLIASLQIQSAARQASIKAIEYSMRREDLDRKKTLEALGKIDFHLKNLAGATHHHQENIIEDECRLDIIAARVDSFKKNIHNYLEVAERHNVATLDELFAEEADLHATRKELIRALYEQIEFEKKELAEALSLTEQRIVLGSKLILGLCLLSIFIAIVIGLLITFSITRPLATLKNMALRIGKGDLKKRINVTTKDEIGQLAVSFNKMTDDLSRSQQQLNNILTTRTVELHSTKQRLHLEESVRKRVEEELKEYQGNLEELVIRRTAELEGARAEVKTLSGLIPICASCKKIRDDQGSWSQLEIYIKERSDAEFSHGICPDCSKKMYPEFYKEDEPEAQ